MLKPVYTEPENCQDCYKCVRECPVKAISVENNKASIIYDRCVFCGHCTQVCPTGAKKVRDGLTRARMTVARHDKVYLSLAPSYISEFMGVSEASLCTAAKKLGFAGVSETALGAELVSDRTDKMMEDTPYSISISSACPVIVNYICKYVPEYRERITPIASPMLAHAKMLKELYGDDIKVVFAGPCIAKKTEADRHPELVDVAITFRDLAEWFESEGIDPAREASPAESNSFVPYGSRSGALYPVEGGMIEGLRKNQDRKTCMSFSGLRTMKDIFSELKSHEGGEQLFLELLACRGGCVNGPARLNSLSPVFKRNEVIRHSEIGAPANDFPLLDLEEPYRDKPVSEIIHSEREILEALAAVGKTSISDELNCSGCGYDSCRDFAVAMLDGRAEENMCVSYMRKIAHDKATVLLHKIPAGVVMVNSQLNVVDMNRAFAAAMGEDTLAVYEVRPGMEGASLAKLTPFANLFKTVLATGEEIVGRRVSHGGKMFLLSIHSIQPQHLVFGLLQDMHEPAVHKEWMLEKTRDVIGKHMETVQEVARLLGENAAFTDSTLRSVIDSLGDGEQKK